MDANWIQFCETLACARDYALKLGAEYGTQIYIVKPGHRPGVHYIEKPMSYDFATPAALGRTQKGWATELVG